MLARWRLAIDLLPLALAAVLALGFLAVVVEQARQGFARDATIRRKLDAAHELDAAMARYHLQVTQVLQEGREQQDALRTARLDMERGFMRLTQEARDQAAAAPSGAETRDLLSDVENARRMRELFHAIDLSAARAVVLVRDGEAEAALQVYEREVDFRLSTELATLLDAVIAEQQQRLQTEATDWSTQPGRGPLIGAVLLLALLGGGMASWLLLARSASRQPGLSADFEARTEQLREANRQLRENDARRAQFLADVSHELRTPLTILRGEADVALLPASQPHEQRRALERIQDQAAELGQLLDDLIAFARSNGDAQPLVLSRVLLDDVVAAAVEEGETLAEPREVAIVFSAVDKGQWVDADLRRLKQALIIGLDNAINHSPPGSVIEVDLKRHAGQARASILDRGPGLGETDAPRVFDRFYRGSGSSHSFGLGIGLAIAKAIIEQHNGTIALANRAGGGAMLTIDLPLSGDLRS